MQTMQQMQSLRAASRQKGFTIIELVVVILLLGILAATALPRFMDVTDQAHDAVVSGVQGGLATGAALFRAQWYAEGQPTTSAVSGFGAGNIFASSSGYPVGTTLGGTNNSEMCVQIYNGLLQSGRPLVASADQPDRTILTDISGFDGGDDGTPIQFQFDDVPNTTISTQALGGTQISFVAVLDIAGANTGDDFWCEYDDGAGGCAPAGQIYDTDAAGPDGFGDPTGTAVVTLAPGTTCDYYYVGQYKTPSEGLFIQKLSFNLTTGEIDREFEFAFEP